MINNPYNSYINPYTNPYINPFNPYNQPAYIPEHRQEIPFVQGIEAAKAYQVAAGSKVILFDSEDQRFYVKQTDANGVPQPMLIFDYVQHKDPEPKKEEVDFSQFVTKEDLEKIIADLKPKRQKKEVADEQTV